VSTEEKYVAAAYLVVFLVVLAYVLIIAAKLQRLEREVTELAELARGREAPVREADQGGGLGEPVRFPQAKGRRVNG
jgi:CcmD family protein